MLLLVLAVFTLSTTVQGNESLWGYCPVVTPMPNFNITQMAGLWYVVDIFERREKCITWEFEQGDNDLTWIINEQRTSGILNEFGIEETMYQTGTLMLDPENPGSMAVSWNLNILGSYSFTVYHTDYDNIAGVFACQQIAFFHRQQGVILSRTPVPISGLRQMTKGKISRFGVDVNYFYKVPHNRCQVEESNSEESLGPIYRGDNV